MKQAFRIRILPLILLLFLAETLFSQTFSLSGKVTDERNRQPLAFVNVVINDGQHGVISDIDGRYAISLDEPILKVKFSSIGYEPKEITLQANQIKCNIALTPKTFELGEVTVEAGENPAHRIIDSLMAHQANNPNSLGSYRYKLYDKMVFTIDSSSFGQAVANDTIKERNDLKIFDSILKKSDLMVMETASEVLFKKPDRKLQNVLGTKVAGMREPTFIYLVNSMQSVSFYDETVSITGTDYVNPIGGMDYYEKDEWARHGLTISFLHRRDSICYRQFGGEFVPDLSIIDMLMFCSKEEIQQILNEYDLL